LRPDGSCFGWKAFFFGNNLKKVKEGKNYPVVLLIKIASFKKEMLKVLSPVIKLIKIFKNQTSFKLKLKYKIIFKQEFKIYFSKFLNSFLPISAKRQLHDRI
jgi:hypothetical protein